MANGHPSRARKSIHIHQNQASGSHDYVAIKKLAAQGDDLARLASTNANITLGALDGIATTSDAIVAGWGTLFPWLKTIPKSVPIMKQYTDAVRWMMRVWGANQQQITEPEWMRSPEHAQNMIRYGEMRPADVAVIQHLNDRLFTHNEDGTLNATSADEIRPYFDPKTPDKWPNLILGSSHALVLDHEDISGAMKGFHSLIMHSFGDSSGKAGARLPLIREVDAARYPTDGKHKQTIMVSAVFNDHNAWVNGGNLLKRLHHLDTLYEAEKNGRVLSQSQLEEAYLKDISPAALHLSKLMLSLIVEEPERVRTGRDVPPIIGDAARPLHLRPDAAHVLQHVKLAGYSKGGNIVTDAVRHLILQLQHEGAVLAPKAMEPQASAVPDQAYVPMSASIISSLIRNVGILTVNPGICPLTDREKSLGMRRISIRNNLDRISAHLFRKHERENRFGTQDDVYVVNGDSMGDLGHGIEGALGTKEKSGYLIDESKVAKADVETLRLVRSRLQAFFASCYDKVGISHVRYDPQNPNQLTVEFSTGVSAEQAAKSTEAIIQAMEAVGLSHVRMQCDMRGDHSCHMQFDALAAGTNIRQLLDQGFKKLAEGHSDIYLSGTIPYELGVAQPDAQIDAATASCQSGKSASRQSARR